MKALPLILCAALVQSLVACSEQTPPPPPLSPEALSAVTKDAGAPKEDLARQVDALFSNPAVGETRALIVMHRGRVAAQRYAEPYDENTRFIGWSMAKSVTGVMIGMLVADGRLQLDGPVPEPRWNRPGDSRADISLRQLLQMRSGLRHTEAGDPPYESSEVQMLFMDGRDDMADWATSQPLEAEPGAKFEYSSSSTVILADIAARVLQEDGDANARRQAVGDYLDRRLFVPLGMNTAFPEYDASGTLIGGSMIHASAPDWAKFGEFLRHGGSVNGAQLIPRKWIDFMKTPSPRSPHYGGQIWLNRERGEKSEGEHPLFPDRANDTMFAAIGHMGQYILVSPRQGLTIVRLGHSNGEERTALLQELADLMALYPEE